MSIMTSPDPSAPLKKISTVTMREDAEAIFMPDSHTSAVRDVIEWYQSQIEIYCAQQQDALVNPSPAVVELVTKAILFQDCGSTEGWEDNTDLALAALGALKGDRIWDQ